MKFTLLAAFVFSVLTSFSQTTPVKKIVFQEYDNYILDKRYKSMPLPDSINTSVAKELRAFALENGFQPKENDVEMILELLKWVSSRWTHDGNNPGDTISSLQILKNAKAGVRYRCVEYGKVLNALLRSFGFVARIVGLKAENSPYGPPGRGHVATEVWSDELGKWIFLDPQNCIYVKHNNQFLNYYDMYLLRKAGKFSEIDFIVSKGYTGYLALGRATEKEHIEKSRAFLNDYWGSMDIPVMVDKKQLNLNLALDNQQPFLSFQGFPSDNLIFTKDPTDIYFPINQNILIFKFNSTNASVAKYNELVKSKVINNYVDQFNQMYQYAATPDFSIYHDHNMPFMDHFDVWLNDKKLIMNSNGYYEAKLAEGLNVIRSVGVNKNGKLGSKTIVKINYQ